jgi:hypothetical protein
MGLARSSSRHKARGSEASGTAILRQRSENQQANELYGWWCQRRNDTKLNRCCRSQDVISFSLIWSWAVLGQLYNFQPCAWLNFS